MDNTMNLNAELLRELSYIADDENYREHPPSLPGREADKGREDESTDMGGDSR